ncbi:hypothetical protein [Streptomyces glomeratus]|uniref:DUF892 family protein n=1 Tax=Streptomyces glomeratus TaxID=284452 RepID=A0ABP6LZJ5_9ACTN|nr:hypothetical protein [Streptomyces glomeratus]MCF1510132.1 hypothetical protein [Streptomyces glomeratus]
MAVTTDALIPVLQDARKTHAALIHMLRADLAVTPAHPHRHTLEHLLADVRAHIDRIDDHVRALRPRRLLTDATALVRTLASVAVRAARIPLEAGAVIADGVLLGGRPATDRQMLRITECEYAAAAQALAACRAGESVAALADDESAMNLLGSLRQRDEEVLRTLENRLEQLALALAEATAGGGRSTRTYGTPTATPARLSGLQDHQSWSGHRPPADTRVGSGAPGTGLQAAAPVAGRGQ